MVQDFFTVVQLGVGIHAGTAILQLSGEFGIAPVERRVDNIARWLGEEREENNILSEQEDQLKAIKARIYIYKLQYAYVYRKQVYIMLGFAAGLLFCLDIMSFVAEADISLLIGLSLVLLCVFPAALYFAYLWQQSTAALAPIERAVSRMEEAIRMP
jgi:hypothetical protein